MNFFQRLLRYLMGVGIGLILVYAFFGQRSCGEWTPQNRVKNLIKDAEIKMTPKMACLLECEGIATNALIDLAVMGEVNFGESQTKTEPKIYRIAQKEGALQSADFKIIGDTLVWVEAFAPQLKGCGCK